MLAAIFAQDYVIDDIGDLADNGVDSMTGFERGKGGKKKAALAAAVAAAETEALAEAQAAAEAKIETEKSAVLQAQAADQVQAETQSSAPALAELEVGEKTRTENVSNAKERNVNVKESDITQIDLEKIRLRKQPDLRRFCWSCTVQGETNTLKLQTKCEQTGFAEACYSGNDGCFVEERQNEGKIEFLRMGCVSTSSCTSSRTELTTGKFPQCNPLTDNQSYCKGCCNGDDECNLSFMTQNKFDLTFAQWLQ